MVLASVLLTKPCEGEKMVDAETTEINLWRQIYVCIFYLDPCKYIKYEALTQMYKIKFYNGYGHISKSHSDCYWTGTNVINIVYPKRGIRPSLRLPEYRIP